MLLIPNSWRALGAVRSRRALLRDAWSARSTSRPEPHRLMRKGTSPPRQPIVACRSTQRGTTDARPTADHAGPPGEASTQIPGPSGGDIR